MGNPERSGGAAASNRNDQPADDPNDCSASPTWAWRRVRVRRPPEAHSDSRPKGDHFRRLPRRDPREPLKITVSYRGGSEAWYELHARGGVLRRPGVISLHEIMTIINNDR